MNRIIIACALALTAATPALAADLPPVAAPRAPAVYVPAVAPVYNWAGIYIGINGGYGFGNSTWNGGGLTSGSFDIDGGLVGGTIGGNFQVGQFVAGVEADGDWSDIRGSTPSTFCAACQTSNNWLATVRGRVGVAWDRVLLFGTGGLAAGDVKATTGVGTDSNTELGWTAGGGIEVGITENFTAKVEYLYVDLQNGSCTASCGAPPTIGVSFTSSLVRGGLNYKFTF